MTVYRIQTVTGKFDHVVGKYAAIKRAKELVGFEPMLDSGDKTNIASLRHLGVTVTPVTKSVARSVGL